MTTIDFYFNADDRLTVAEDELATIPGIHDAPTVPGTVEAQRETVVAEPPTTRETIAVEEASLAALVQSSLSTSPGALAAPE